MIPGVEETVARYQMLAPGDTVTVALSGGVDSVSLLHVLLGLQREWSLSVRACHVNHGLREAAGRDEAFCRELCGKWGVPLTVTAADVRAQAAKSGESLEMCGRRLRYAALRRAAGEAGKIATAHQLNDQLETFFINLLRGTGLSGLCGIPAVRGQIIRPLLFTARQEIEAYAAQNGLSYVEDETNAAPDFLRNRIRWSVIPALEAAKGEEGFALAHAFGRAFMSLQSDEACLQGLAKEAYRRGKSPTGLLLESVRDQDWAVGRRMLALAAREAGALPLRETGISALRALVNRGKGRVQLSGGWFARLRRKTLEFVFLQAERAVEAADFCAPLQEGRIRVPGGGFSCRKYLAGRDDEKIHKLLFNSAVDCAKIGSNPVVRTRKPGDQLSLPGRGTKSLKKLLNEAGVPPESRSRLLLLADDRGVLWLEGFGPDKRCAPDESTREVFVLTRE